MAHIYHVEAQAARYYRHIPHVPVSFTVSRDLLFGIGEREFVDAFRQLADIMKSMYRDMETRAEAYGLPLVDINAVNENKADGNLAKASWRAIKRLGDIMLELGRLGTLYGGELIVPVGTYKAAVKKISKSQLVLDRLIDFGFGLTAYENGQFGKGAEAFTVTYPDNPHVICALKAYAVSAPYHEDDPHEFHYFDYKRVADRDALPRHCAASDLAALLPDDGGRLLAELHKYFTDELKYTPHYKDESMEYYLKKKRIARFIIDFSDLSTVLILKLKDMDRYIDIVATLPGNLRAYFEHSTCRHCDFQGATEDFCKFRVIWSLDGVRHEVCGFFAFSFMNPESKDAGYFKRLMEAEYGAGA